MSSLIYKIFDQNQNDVASVPCFLLQGVVAELTQLVQDAELKAFAFFFLIYLQKSAGRISVCPRVSLRLEPKPTEVV